MSGTWRGPAAFVVAVASLGVAAGTVRPHAAPARPATAESIPVTSSSIVCPDTTGESDGATVVTVANVSRLLAGGTSKRALLSTTLLTGPKAKTSTLGGGAINRISTTTDGTAIAVTAGGAGADSVAADENRLIPRGLFRALFSAPCLAPATDWWIGGTDGRTGYADRLFVANPGTTIANITVTAWSLKGRQEPPALQSYSITPNSTASLAVSQFVPNSRWVTLHVHANTGRVVSEVIDRRLVGIQPVGADWIPPTRAPARDLVVPGYLGGAGSRRLLVTNPGKHDATVSLKLVTTTGDFAPAGHQTVVVPAGQSSELELDQSLGGVPGAVVLSSDQDIVAAGYSVADRRFARDRPDLQWQPAAMPITRPAVLPDNAPPFGETARIYLTAPDAQARVRVTLATGDDKVLTVPAGRTLAVDQTGEFGTASYGPMVFTPVSGGPAYVSRTLYAFGAHGPLVTCEQPTPLPAPIILPAVLPDSRAAIP